MIIPLTRETAELYLPQLITLSEICWGEIMTPPWNRAAFMMEAPRKWELSCAYLVDDQIVGCMIASEPTAPKDGQRPDGGHIAYIHKVVVHPNFRRGGIALSLRQYVAELARSLGFRELRSSVSTNNTASMAYIRKHGAQINSTTTPNETGVQLHLTSLLL